MSEGETWVSRDGYAVTLLRRWDERPSWWEVRCPDGEIRVVPPSVWALLGYRRGE